ncbi:Aminodeoxychorismate/anthranilate synthase component 2 [Pseudobythopirellula maris]|uniref:Aminodeoxychorismate/anthranilate synthase component 2 n=1 Tax=Pseudobythopirellula maris TaxID=2527991 RepID=A0A5C5ZS84_9BACT|nr:aminodeoxychorismate/anthranilate synthase component II [Pseudobythopirellula maris]TWT90170.1 Aminodeoxychorismate/anthranilate synthase component 2 [Pseudobythopirellula maris]
MILLVDNYDSFVHNLARYLRRLGEETLVVRNDAVDAEGVAKLAPHAVVLSPGPGGPLEAGRCVELVRALSGATPLLGVCLGHQAIAQALGARVERSPRPWHGRTSLVEHDGQGLFAGLPSPLTACRYHSLSVAGESLPTELIATAWSDDGVLMAMRHATAPTYGVQFHPEAVLTDHGLELLRNFVGLAQRFHGEPATSAGVSATA